MNSSLPEPFSDSAAYAEALDRDDPLAALRSRFRIPEHRGREAAYLCGHSLGLQPGGVAERVAEELEAWARLGVDAHFRGPRPWVSYHETVREDLAWIVGAHPDEVVAMNSLTVNLHLMLATFYRPQGTRTKILVEAPTFPSDRFALRSHVAWHGLDPDAQVVEVAPGDEEPWIREEIWREALARHGPTTALVWFSGVQFVTGQLFPIASIVEEARRHGCLAGFDLAHAVGNVPLDLHAWDVDFAVWCSYKYLNAGPGAVGGCFVHRRHGQRPDLPRLAGWWGQDPSVRFRMHLEPRFLPAPGADGWQVSNPPVLALAPLQVSLERFREAGMEALRRKSLRLTSYARRLLEAAAPPGVRILTPPSEDQRGSMISLSVEADAEDVVRLLRREGVFVDARPPDVIRAAAAPSYNSFSDLRRFVDALVRVLGDGP